MRTILTLITALVLSVGLHAQQITTGPGSIVQTGNGNTTATAPETALTHKEPAPLSDIQKAALLLAAKDARIAYLEAEALKKAFETAAATYQTAEANLRQLMASMTPEGYQLNEKLELVKKPEEKSSEKPIEKKPGGQL